MFRNATQAIVACASRNAPQGWWGSFAGQSASAGRILPAAIRDV